MDKKIILTIIFVTIVTICRQNSRAESVQVYFGSDTGQQEKKVTATMTSSSRLFKSPDDLTSVILIIPRGSRVDVLAADSTFFIVSFEGNDGFIYKRHAVIDETAGQAEADDNRKEEVIPADKEPVKKPESRFSYLENKYGSSIAARIYEGKIWKGMNAEMIKDSWGRAERINREINGNTVREEWLYKTTRLYLENNTLMGWGPVR